jgi:hypothetical protein
MRPSFQKTPRLIDSFKKADRDSRLRAALHIFGVAILLLAARTRLAAQLVHVNSITTFAGNGIQRFAGDGAAANSAELSGPESVAVGEAGELYIGDYIDIDNHLGVVRKVGPIVFPATDVGASSALRNLYLQTTAAETIASFTVPLPGGKQEYTVGMSPAAPRMASHRIPPGPSAPYPSPSTPRWAISPPASTAYGAHSSNPGFMCW